MSTFIRLLFTIIYDTALFVLLGLLVSGVAHELVAASERARRLVRGKSLARLSLFGLAGLAFPVCSCGVVPLAVSMRRHHGSALGNVFAFLFTAPSTSMLAVVVCLAVLGPVFTLYFVAGGVVCGLAIGLFFYALESLAPQAMGQGATAGCGCEPPHNPDGASFLRRVLHFSFVVYGARISFDQIVGLGLCALVFAFAPMDRYLDWLAAQPFAVAAAVVLLMALPAFVCSIPAIVLAGVMALKGLPPELLWIFIMAGPVTNLGDMNVLRRQIGRVPTLCYVAAVLCVVAGFGLLMKYAYAGSEYVKSAMLYFNAPAVYDSCVAALSGAGQPGQPFDLWDALRLLAMPLYLALVSLGALMSLRELFENPCAHCRDYQSQAGGVVACATSCWKKNVVLSALAVTGGRAASWRTVFSGRAWRVVQVAVIGGTLAGSGLVYQVYVAGYDGSPQPLPAALKAVEGYPERFSVPAGQPVALRFAGGPLQQGRSVAQVLVVNPADGRTLAAFPGQGQPVPGAVCQSYMDEGCNYPGRLELPTQTLPPGLHAAKIVDSAGETGPGIFFNVLPAPEAWARVVLLLPTFSWQAYNPAGGYSYYTPQKTRLRKVSLARPLSLAQEADSPLAALPYLSYLAQRGQRVTTIDDKHLHDAPDALDGAELLVIVGHSEYWSYEMRATVERFLNRGGRMLVAGGNTCWWKVRLAGQVMECDQLGKDHEPDFRLVTGNWYDAPVGDPEERTFGLSFRFAGYPLRNRFQLTDAGQAQAQAEYGISPSLLAQSGGYEVLKPDHRLFAGLGFAKGSVFGAHVPLVGGEIDGLPVTAPGVIDYGQAPKAPEDFAPLAQGFFVTDKLVSPVIMGHFAYNGAGQVVQLGSIDWYKGMRAQDPAALAVFANALDMLLEAGPPQHKALALPGLAGPEAQGQPLLQLQPQSGPAGQSQGGAAPASGPASLAGWAAAGGQPPTLSGQPVAALPWRQALWPAQARNVRTLPKKGKTLLTPDAPDAQAELTYRIANHVQAYPQKIVLKPDAVLTDAACSLAVGVAFDDAPPQWRSLDAKALRDGVEVAVNRFSPYATATVTLAMRRAGHPARTTDSVGAVGVYGLEAGVSFAGDLMRPDEALAGLTTWSLGGLDMGEGRTWRWGTGPLTTLAFESDAARPMQLAFALYNPEPGQSVRVLVNGAPAARLEGLERRDWMQQLVSATVSFEAKPGTNVIELRYGKWNGKLIPPFRRAEKRPLAVAFTQMRLVSK